MKRDEYVKFRVSKEEKELIQKYAESLGISASRFIRNLVMQESIKAILRKKEK